MPTVNIKKQYKLMFDKIRTLRIVSKIENIETK